MAEYRAVFSPSFQQDIRNIIQWSDEHFGVAAGDRYASLIKQAMRDVRADPQRVGAKKRPDLALHAYVYHLTHSRGSMPGETVRTPRHFILYRFAGEVVAFARLLHDSRDLRQHLPHAFDQQDVT